MFTKFTSGDLIVLVIQSIALFFLSNQVMSPIAHQNISVGGCLLAVPTIVLCFYLYYFVVIKLFRKE